MITSVASCLNLGAMRQVIKKQLADGVTTRRVGLVSTGAPRARPQRHHHARRREGAPLPSRVWALVLKGYGQLGTVEDAGWHVAMQFSTCSPCSHPQQRQVVIKTEERSTWVHAWLAWSCHEGSFAACKHAVHAVFNRKKRLALSVTSRSGGRGDERRVQPVPEEERGHGLREEGARQGRHGAQGGGTRPHQRRRPSPRCPLCPTPTSRRPPLQPERRCLLRERCALKLG